jgi:hypothetical protein
MKKTEGQKSCETVPLNVKTSTVEGPTIVRSVSYEYIKLLNTHAVSGAE